MDGEPSSRGRETAREVSSARAAELLLDPTVQASLLPFFAGPTSIGNAAEETGVKVNTLYKRVKRLESLGLLEVARQRPRAGRAVKLYRTTAARFWVPFHVMSADTLESQMIGGEAYWVGEFRRSFNRTRYDDPSQVGFEIYRDEGGFVAVETKRLGQPSSPGSPGEPALLDLWSDELALDFDDAKALQAELYAVYRKYRAKRGAQPYLLRLGLTPWLE